MSIYPTTTLAATEQIWDHVEQTQLSQELYHRAFAVVGTIVYLETDKQLHPHIPRVSRKVLPEELQENTTDYLLLIAQATHIYSDSLPRDLQLLCVTYPPMYNSTDEQSSLGVTNRVVFVMNKFGIWSFQIEHALSDKDKSQAATISCTRIIPGIQKFPNTQDKVIFMLNKQYGSMTASIPNTNDIPVEELFPKIIETFNVISSAILSLPDRLMAENQRRQPQ